MNKIICVYSSSSCLIDQIYVQAAERLGRQIAANGDSLLFGGGMTGLMGVTARAVHQSNGKVIGIIPKALNVKNIVYENCDELIVTEDMRTRKAIMDARSDAFIALPGGYGTLEELLEMITLKQLRYHNKPIVILNVNNFYQALLEQFDTILNQQFAKPECQKLYFVTTDIHEALRYIEDYQPEVINHKYC
ncbi:MAG TPA: TIGR00730 family Rossman fold protein [Bacillota bacterium]|nr:TIGR00730 family Rossman fold protein [Bacillota bacterium]HOL09085.1 TIGR00730 family Rossman fold protein [Bacillota bacterium]HPO98037.1 TIGR00730 family Rossman fold protein [Bacillota bacterium]